MQFQPMHPSFCPPLAPSTPTESQTQSNSELLLSFTSSNSEFVTNNNNQTHLLQSAKPTTKPTHCRLQLCKTHDQNPRLNPQVPDFKLAKLNPDPSHRKTLINFTAELRPTHLRRSGSCSVDYCDKRSTDKPFECKRRRTEPRASVRLLRRKNEQSTGVGWLKCRG
ncbi:hypothetical protein BVRB_6g140090 [Beta vulgaris subsp. vulgaris]|nr:hypothetical protein BVRB_6g140090 [Beta vulgaris subsp. vulgaris]